MLVLLSMPCDRQDKGADSDTSGCSQEEDFVEGEMYLLPLGACVGEDKEAAEAAGYQLPLDCEVSQLNYALFLPVGLDFMRQTHVHGPTAVPSLDEDEA